VADGDDRAPALGDGLGDSLRGRARREPFVHVRGGLEDTGQELAGLSGSKERARKDDRGAKAAIPKALSERAGLLTPGRSERAELVGRSGGRLCVADEEKLHPARQNSSGERVDRAARPPAARSARHNGPMREQRGRRKPRRPGRATSDAERRRLAQAAREKHQREQPSTPVLWCDGGSRGNPGPAAFAFVLDVPDGPCVTASGHLERASVSAAEYHAVVAGLRRAAELGVSDVEVRLDARVVAQQLSGEREPRNPELRDLLDAARRAAVAVRPVSYRWIPRESNGRANALVAEALGL
jgi:ribonuclease HI